MGRKFYFSFYLDVIMLLVVCMIPLYLSLSLSALIFTLFCTYVGIYACRLGRREGGGEGRVETGVLLHSHFHLTAVDWLTGRTFCSGWMG
ncbi:hypothetical protein F5X99DRAFT_373987 [Biscogniauxia marginata]|nr:hypothetical protein F5X99DRAFT_373987 [Biscogniauxia marginata]